MKKYILYTTKKTKYLEIYVDSFARKISKTKGRGEVEIDIVEKIIKKVPVGVDSDGDILFSFDWFRQQFPKGDYDGVIFHFRPEERKRWKMTRSINGSRNKDNREYPEFWVCADDKAMAEGYDALPEIMRLLCHEHGHYDEDLDDQLANLLTQDSVHDFDYRLKKIHIFHLLVDYRGQAYKEQVNKVINAVIKLVKKYI